MAARLAEVTIKAPVIPVVQNVTASAETDPDVIREQLVTQVTGSVRWRESVAWMAAQGVDEIWELGAGKALCGMIRRIERSVATRAIGAPKDVADAMEVAAL